MERGELGTYVAFVGTDDETGAFGCHLEFWVMVLSRSLILSLGVGGEISMGRGFAIFGVGDLCGHVVG